MRVFFCFLVLGVVAPVALADAVRLHPQAVVASEGAQGADITLGDVAELEGPDARALRRLVVGRFPAGADGIAFEVVVPIDTVRRHLDAAAVNLSALAVKGARSCRVVRGDAAQAAGPLASLAATPLRVPATPVVPVTHASSSSVTDGDPTLSQRITSRLEGLAAADPGTLKITFRGAADAAAQLNASASDRDVEIKLESRTGLGRVPVRVRCFADDGQVYEFRLTADVVQRVGVVVVTAPIGRGDRFTVDNVAVQRIDRGRARGTPVVALDALLGRTASAALRVGTPVIQRHLAPDVLVRRGDLVTVIVRRGRLAIRTVGRAAEDGERGAIIALRNDATREQFYATVSGPRRATIDAGESSSR